LTGGGEWVMQDSNLRPAD